MDEYGITETSYFDHTAEPADQKKQRIEEEMKVNEGIQLLEDMIKRWDERITFYDSLDSIDVDPTTHPEEHLRQVIANKQTRNNLIQEKEYLITLKQK